MLNDAKWCSMMLNDAQWFSLMIDNAWWSLMMFDDAWWYLNVLPDVVKNLPVNLEKKVDSCWGGIEASPKEVDVVWGINSVKFSLVNQQQGIKTNHGRKRNHEMWVRKSKLKVKQWMTMIFHHCTSDFCYIMYVTFHCEIIVTIIIVIITCVAGPSDSSLPAGNHFNTLKQHIY